MNFRARVKMKQKKGMTSDQKNNRVKASYIACKTTLSSGGHQSTVSPVFSSREVLMLKMHQFYWC